MDQYEKQMIDVVNRHHALVTRRPCNRQHIIREMEARAKAERRQELRNAIVDFAAAVLLTLAVESIILFFLIAFM